MSTAVLHRPEIPAPPALRPQNDVVLLRGVTWEQYLALRDNPDNTCVRMDYADGELLQMTTGAIHERISTVFSLVLLAWAQFSGARVMGFGRWTMQQKVSRKGLEADNCYYVRHLPQVQHKKTIELGVDPPPDLAIEVDITTHSRLKFEIYKALGVPEVWVWEGDRMAAHCLAGDVYQPVSESVELPGFPLEAAGQFIAQHIQDDDVAVMNAFRELLEA